MANNVETLKPKSAFIILIPLLLSSYLARQFLLWFSLFFSLLLVVTTLFETIELIRRASGKNDIPLMLILEMAVLKIPDTVQRFLIFNTLFSSLGCFWKLTRTSELNVTRAAGISAWQFTFPAAFAAAVIGILASTVMNPLSTVLWSRYESIEAEILKRKANTLALDDQGLWLKQGDKDNGTAILRANSVETKPLTLIGVIIFRFNDQGALLERIDASRAQLTQGAWKLEKSASRPARSITAQPGMTIFPTSLTNEQIQESFGSPNAISFWNLPDFISQLEATGFTAIRHRIHYHRLLSQPLLMAVMTMLAACFALRMHRNGFILPFIAGGIGIGLFLFTTTHYIYALGASSRIPVILAAWSPPLLVLMISTSLFFYLEDG